MPPDGQLLVHGEVFECEVRAGARGGARRSKQAKRVSEKAQSMSGLAV